MPLFDRVCKILVNTGGSTTEDVFLELDQSFRLTFDITINEVGANQCTVQIYNLSYANRQKVKNIIKENNQRQKQDPPLPRLTLQVFAGYAEGDGLEFLYSGDIEHTVTIYQPPDYITTISVYAGALDFRGEFVKLAYKAGIDTKTILNQIASALKMGIDKASVFGDTLKFSNGLSLSGQAKGALDKVAEMAGLRYVVTANKTLKFAPIGQSSADEILLLSPETGVINPVKELDSQFNQLGDFSILNGWEVDTLLQPKAIPPARVKVETKEVQGIFYIQSVEHKGDTRGNEWMSVLQVRESVV